MAVPTFQAIVVIDIESFGSRADSFRVSPRCAMREVIDAASFGPAVHGDQVAGDRTVHLRAGRHE